MIRHKEALHPAHHEVKKAKIHLSKTLNISHTLEITIYTSLSSWLHKDLESRWHSPTGSLNTA